MIEDFGLGQLDAAATLFRDVFNGEPWNDAWEAASARARLHDLLRTPGAQGVCLHVDGRLVGFALGHAETWYTGRHFFLGWMCVETTS